MSKFMPFLFLLLAAACTKKTEPVAEMTEPQLAERGASIYQMNCTACHNADPTKDGVLGPAIAGSSMDLLRERVMRAQYPPDYKPKRDTHQMAALPHLEKELPALRAFLNKGPGAYQ